MDLTRQVIAADKKDDPQKSCVGVLELFLLSFCPALDVWSAIGLSWLTFSNQGAVAWRRALERQQRVGDHANDMRLLVARQWHDEGCINHDGRRRNRKFNGSISIECAWTLGGMPPRRQSPMLQP